MKRKKRKPGYTDQFLLNNDCEPGFCIEMTENSFMLTDAAWINITKKVILPMAFHLYNSVPEGSTSYPHAFTKKCAEAILLLVFEMTVTGSVKRKDLITTIQENAIAHPSAMHDAMTKHPFEQSKNVPRLHSPKMIHHRRHCGRTPEGGEDNYILHNEDNPSSPESSHNATSSTPPVAAARSMSGYLYRWSLRSHPENALDLALAVFNVVNEIHHNNVVRHH
jgi:hypothetical protein